MDTDMEAFATGVLATLTQISIILACWSFIVWVWWGA